tara:strand:- start:7029 stop:7163 length:135 start_codon:yes stop_codon:yes gene_type:complete
MSQTKQHKKINKLQLKAELCLDRDVAKEIILKANKVQNKFRQLP